MKLVPPEVIDLGRKPIHSVFEGNALLQKRELMLGNAFCASGGRGHPSALFTKGHHFADANV
jgi:hypothetical protein